VGACVGAWAAAQRWRASAALSEVHAPRRAAAAWLHNVRHHRREGDLRRRPRAEAQRHPQRHAQRRRQVSHRRDSRRRHWSAGRTWRLGSGNTQPRLLSARLLNVHGTLHSQAPRWAQPDSLALRRQLPLRQLARPAHQEVCGAGGGRARRRAGPEQGGRGAKRAAPRLLSDARF